MRLTPLRRRLTPLQRAKREERRAAAISIRLLGATHTLEWRKTTWAAVDRLLPF